MVWPAGPHSSSLRSCAARGKGDRALAGILNSAPPVCGRRPTATHSLDHALVLAEPGEEASGHLVSGGQPPLGEDGRGGMLRQGEELVTQTKAAASHECAASGEGAEGQVTTSPTRAPSGPAQLCTADSPINTHINPGPVSDSDSVLGFLGQECAISSWGTAFAPSPQRSLGVVLLSRGQDS